MTKKTPTKDTALLDALRSNLNLLGEIAMRYQVETQPERPSGDLPVISCPDDVRRLLGPEMAPLAQEQLRVLLLNTKNQVMGQRVIYQGNVSSAIVRTAEVFRRRSSKPSPASSSATITRPAIPRPAPRTRPSPASWSRRASCWTSSCSTTWSSAGSGSSASRNGASCPDPLSSTGQATRPGGAGRPALTRGESLPTHPRHTSK